MIKKVNSGAMLNVYPDSIGDTLKGLVDFLTHPKVRGAFQSCYILPSIFNSDLDRGFSVIDYELNKLLVDEKDLTVLKDEQIDLKLDFILNHASVLSPQFQDIIKKGEQSLYKDFFINWNRFWDGYGQMTEDGYVQPDEELIQKMFFRKPGLPFLMVRMPDGKEVPYWNTFYQEVRYKRLDAQDIIALTNLQYLSADLLAKKINHYLEGNNKLALFDWGIYKEHKFKISEYLESSRRYLGQMDLNIESPLVWEFYSDTLKKLAGYGASLVRLDAFAYAPKQPGERNFLNDPGTWQLLEGINKLATPLNLQLLPEIHSRYEEKIHETIAEKGYLTYDFFLPGLIIDAFESGSKERLEFWAHELITKKIRTVNMLGCHDGIPLLDLKGLIDDDRIQRLIDTVVQRGGYVKDLHGQKNVYYQVNATYFSALGESESRLLLARALQLFMPGKPQIWYLDLFAGKNDHEAVKVVGAGGHKEINRTNLSLPDIKVGLESKIVEDQLELLRFRNSCNAFGSEGDFKIDTEADDSIIYWIWTRNGHRAILDANLKTYCFKIEAVDEKGEVYFSFEQRI